MKNSFKVWKDAQALLRNKKEEKKAITSAALIPILITLTMIYNASLRLFRQ